MATRGGTDPVRGQEGAESALGQDEQRLQELGYKQELSRAWSGFTNFAISFTIISVLAGTFTAFPFAWQNGGPIAASIGWPVLCAFVLTVGCVDGRADVALIPRPAVPTGGRTTSAARAGAG